ncbi:RHS repeat-associated core domain-containing protein [Kribbella sp. NPDC059898]|uniref:RHS repeat-associated core domain-containing protein n=1 Tax=Kribbella sp. NPDC059898 TaxID=3346995 RepID=UPI00365F7874
MAAGTMKVIVREYHAARLRDLCSAWPRESEKVGTAQSITTRYTFVGLANQVTAEEEEDTAGTWKTSKSYSYGAGGDNLSLVDSPVNGTTSKKSFYGTNPHGDVETLTDSTGSTTSTYRYTAYGQPDNVGTTGDDKITGTATDDADIVNPYRFNSARFNGATGTYDMGFREYNPGLNRFLTRDMFNGALSDLSLGSDPWNTNRYMFGGGNPISRIELNGHMNALDSSGGGGFTTENLQRCGTGCTLDGATPVGAREDSVTKATNNFLSGAVSGTIKTVEAVEQGPLAPIYHVLGGGGLGTAYDDFAAKNGADTDSKSYTAGEIVGIPIPGAGLGRTGAKVVEAGVSEAAS